MGGIPWEANVSSCICHLNAATVIMKGLISVSNNPHSYSTCMKLACNLQVTRM